MVVLWTSNKNSFNKVISSVRNTLHFFDWTPICYYKYNKNTNIKRSYSLPVFVCCDEKNLQQTFSLDMNIKQP